MVRISAGGHGSFHSGFDLVHLSIVARLTGLHAGRLLTQVIVEGDSDAISPDRLRRHGTNEMNTYFKGEFLWGVEAPPERRCLGFATRGMADEFPWQHGLGQHALSPFVGDPT